ncbi:hypothetical protein CROQUDRAFT_86890 [Cronartium quercuum f. sp. fusiforme G11]|uniref:Uncharacterized protein n=1 Tax=Cronartium quercuum f. sp. fusiforme G11 TaxID=708437 RepID=A0A9P6NW40_9BASI|nr:hypothetical protein CROQUDRAFT_86890 [Cronartium quercuum f. sp. fusiforme G11]
MELDQGTSQTDGPPNLAPPARPFVNFPTSQPQSTGTPQSTIPTQQFITPGPSTAPTVMVEQSEQVVKGLDDIFKSILTVAKLQLQLQRVNANRFVDNQYLFAGHVKTLNERIVHLNSNLDEIEKFAALGMAVVQRDMRRAHAISLSQMIPTEIRINELRADIPNADPSSTIPEAEETSADVGCSANDNSQMNGAMNLSLPTLNQTDPQIGTNPITDDSTKMDVDPSPNLSNTSDSTMKADLAQAAQHATIIEGSKATTESNIDPAFHPIADLDPVTSDPAVSDAHKRAVREMSGDDSGEGDALAAALLPTSKTPIIIDDDSEPPKKKQHLIDLTTPSPPPAPRTFKPGSSPKLIDLAGMEEVAGSGEPVADLSSRPTESITLADNLSRNEPGHTTDPSLITPAENPSQSALPDLVAANAETMSKSGSSEAADGDLFGDGSLFGSSHNNSASPSPLDPLGPSPSHSPGPPNTDAAQLLNISSFLSGPVPQTGSVSEAIPTAVDLSAFLSTFGQVDASTNAVDPVLPTTTSTSTMVPGTEEEQLNLQALGVVDSDSLSQYLS